jgi:hypothetical protein
VVVKAAMLAARIILLGLGGFFSGVTLSPRLRLGNVV